ncbi:unnamed protein product [Closterium sp. NIES-53]
MIHAAALYFLWLFAVQYAAHQLNLWPRVSEPETSPTLRWTGKVGDASIFRVWCTLSLVRDAKASKLSSCTLRCVFLGFPTDALPWQFYHPRLHRVFSSRDVTFDESVSFYRLHPHTSQPAPLVPLFLVLVPPPWTNPSYRVLLPQHPAAVDYGAGAGGDTRGEGSGGAETEVEGSGGSATGGADSRGDASPSGGGAVGDPAGGPGAGQPQHSGYSAVGTGAASPGGTAGAGGAGGTAGGTSGARGAGGTVGGVGGAAGARGAGAASLGGTIGAGGAGDPVGGAGAASPGGTAGAGGTSGGAGGAAGAGGAGAASPGGTAGAGGAGGPVGGAGAASLGGTAGTGGTAGGVGGAASARGPRAASPGGTAERGAPYMVHQVLQRFSFTWSSPQPTPLPTGHSLSAPPSDESVEPSGPYTELVGCLMYLMTCTRADLAYPLGLLARYVPPGRHRKLTYLLTDLGERPRSPPVLYVDNKAMLALCYEQRLEHRTKHNALRYFLARELQQRRQLRRSYVASRSNTADVFIKVLGFGDHQRFCTALGLVPTLPHLLVA